jgi:sec-independent protein translocase protein TatA
MLAVGGPFGLGPLELVVILLVLVMIFGATRLADLGGSLGKGIREFKRNVKEGEEEEAEAETKPPAATAATAAPAAPVAAAATPPVADNGAETISAVKCPSCGNLNPVGARHCNNCGAAIATPVS